MKQRKKKFTPDPEKWMPILFPEVKPIYEVSNLGRVRNVERNKLCHITQHRTVPMVVKSEVTLSLKNDKRKVYRVSRLVWAMFMNGGKKLPKSIRIFHKNEMSSDDDLKNLYIADMHAAGGKNRKPIIKVDRDGNILACYRSIRAAAKAEYLSTTTVTHMCQGKRADKYKYGWRLMYDDGGVNDIYGK